jgi:hypothetical protein
MAGVAVHCAFGVLTGAAYRFAAEKNPTIIIAQECHLVRQPGFSPKKWHCLSRAIRICPTSIRVEIISTR